MATEAEIKDSLYEAFASHAQTVNPTADAASIQMLLNYCEMLATAIASAITAGGGGGGETPILTDYVKKSGGIDAIMSGLLTANTGFKAGGNNQLGIDVSWNATDSVVDVKFAGRTDFGIAHPLYSNGRQFMSFSNTGSDESITIGGSDFALINLASAVNIPVVAGLTVGTDAGNKFVVNNTDLTYGGNQIWHAGNSNQLTMDWKMKDATVGGDLTVSGITTLNGYLNALYGFRAGYLGAAKLEVDQLGLKMLGSNIYIPSGYGIMNTDTNMRAIGIETTGDTALNATGRNLLLGYTNTQNVYLMAPLTNENGQRRLIDQFGKGTFLWEFEAGYDGVTAMQAVSRGDANTNKGILFNNFIEIFNSNIKLAGNASNQLIMTLGVNNTLNLGINTTTGASFTTSSDKYYFNVPLWAVNGVGVYGTSTQMLANRVVVGSALDGTQHYLMNMADGIKHYGHSYFTGNIGTENYASGFSGYGWRMDFDINQLTLDRLVVRKTFRAYEMEIQKINVMSGSYWFSSSCSGDYVEEIIN